MSNRNRSPPNNYKREISCNCMLSDVLSSNTILYMLQAGAKFFATLIRREQCSAEQFKPMYILVGGADMYGLLPSGDGITALISLSCSQLLCLIMFVRYKSSIRSFASCERGA